MYIHDTQWSTFFVALSLLSTGLSIVAVGLLIDYSSDLLAESKVSIPNHSPSETVAKVAGAGVTAGEIFYRSIDSPAARQSNLSVSTRDNRRKLLVNSLLMDAVLHKLEQRKRIIDGVVDTGLMTLKPAALNIQIRNDISVFDSRPNDEAPGTYDRRSIGG